MKESFKITALVGIQKLDKFGKLGTRDPNMFDMKWLIGCFIWESCDIYANPVIWVPRYLG